MSYLAATKFGDCSQCDATQTAVIKVGKNLYCVYCHKNNKTKVQIEKAQAKQKIQSSLSKLAKTEGNKEMVGKEQSKSELMKEADRLFGNFIKNRDKFSVFDEDLGEVVEKITCPCCHNSYTLDCKTASDKNVVNALHFVDRDVYSLRFDEENVHAGCCYCNLKQHLNSKGREYNNFREFLVNKYGEEHIAEMEVAHRKINRLEESQIKVVIELYSN